VLPPIAGSVRALAEKVQIPRKQWEVIAAVWEDHDIHRNGAITENDFVKAVHRLDEKKAEREGERIRARYFDKNVGDTVGALAELRYVQGKQARTRHASSMFQTVTERTKKSKNPHDNRIELVDFVAMFFPHLGRSAIQRACDYYAEKPPPPKPIKTFEQKLDEVPEAREEIRAIFERLDGDKDGLVRMKSLEPMMIEHGISESDVQGWLQEGATGEMCRMKSKLDVEDMQRLLGPVYIPPSPKDNNDCVSEGKEISKSIDRQHAILLDVMYGKCR